MLPKVINWAKHEGGDVFTEPIAEVVSKELGVPVKVLLSTGVKEKNMSLATGEYHLCFISNTNYYDNMRGTYYEDSMLGAYKSKLFETFKPEFAPPTFRLMFAGWPSIGGCAVRANSDIYKISALKGKTIAIADANAPVAINAVAGLAFGGLTLDDVKIVRAGTVTSGLKMLLEGKVDAAYGGVTGRRAEIATRLLELRWLPLPHADTEGWERLWKIRPMLKKAVYNDGIMKGKQWEGFTAFFMLVTMDSQSEDFIYAIAKAMHEGYPKFKDKAAPIETAHITIEKTLDLENYNPILIPYHPGLIKLAKELGRWTQQHDEYQAKALKDQKHWIASWKAKYEK